MIIHIRLIFFGLVIIAFSQFSTVGVFAASAAELTREQVIDLMISITKKRSKWHCKGYTPCSAMNETKFRFEEKYGDLIVRYLDASPESGKLKNKKETGARLELQGQRGWQVRWRTFRWFPGAGQFPRVGVCLVASIRKVNCKYSVLHAGSTRDKEYEFYWVKK